MEYRIRLIKRIGQTSVEWLEGLHEAPRERERRRGPRHLLEVRVEGLLAARRGHPQDLELVVAFSFGELVVFDELRDEVSTRFAPACP